MRLLVALAAAAALNPRDPADLGQAYVDAEGGTRPLPSVTVERTTVTFNPPGFARNTKHFEGATVAPPEQAPTAQPSGLEGVRHREPVALEADPTAPAPAGPAEHELEQEGPEASSIELAAKEGAGEYPDDEDEYDGGGDGGGASGGGGGGGGGGDEQDDNDGKHPVTATCAPTPERCNETAWRGHCLGCTKRPLWLLKPEEVSGAELEANTGNYDTLDYSHCPSQIGYEANEATPQVGKGSTCRFYCCPDRDVWGWVDPETGQEDTSKIMIEKKPGVIRAIPLCPHTASGDSENVKTAIWKRFCCAGKGVCARNSRHIRFYNGAVLGDEKSPMYEALGENMPTDPEEIALSEIMIYKDVDQDEYSRKGHEAKEKEAKTIEGWQPLTLIREVGEKTRSPFSILGVFVSDAAHAKLPGVPVYYIMNKAQGEGGTIGDESTTASNVKKALGINAMGRALKKFGRTLSLDPEQGNMYCITYPEDKSCNEPYWVLQGRRQSRKVVDRFGDMTWVLTRGPWAQKRMRYSVRVAQDDEYGRHYLFPVICPIHLRSNEDAHEYMCTPGQASAWWEHGDEGYDPGYLASHEDPVLLAMLHAIFTWHYGGPGAGAPPEEPEDEVVDEPMPCPGGGMRLPDGTCSGAGGVVLALLAALVSEFWLA